MKSSLPTRRLIPRWRSTTNTLEQVEATSTNQKAATGRIEEDEGKLDEAIAEWRETKSPGMLGEVLSFSVDPGLLSKVVEIGYEALRRALQRLPFRKRSFMGLEKRKAAWTFHPLFQATKAVCRTRSNIASGGSDRCFGWLRTTLLRFLTLRSCRPRLARIRLPNGLSELR